MKYNPSIYNNYSVSDNIALSNKINALKSELNEVFKTFFDSVEKFNEKYTHGFIGDILFALPYGHYANEIMQDIMDYIDTDNHKALTVGTFIVLLCTNPSVALSAIPFVADKYSKKYLKGLHDDEFFFDLTNTDLEKLAKSTTFHNDFYKMYDKFTNQICKCIEDSRIKNQLTENQIDDMLSKIYEKYENNINEKFGPSLQEVIKAMQNDTIELFTSFDTIKKYNYALQNLGKEFDKCIKKVNLIDSQSHSYMQEIAEAHQNLCFNTAYIIHNMVKEGKLDSWNDLSLCYLWTRMMVKYISETSETINALHKYFKNDNVRNKFLKNMKFVQLSYLEKY